MKAFALLSTVAFLGQLAFSTGQTLNIVAHQDDDLLFLSPDLLHEIQSGRSVRTIYVTAGDAGEGANYWQGRQAGSQAAYAEMSDAANSWTQSDAGIPGYYIPVFTLTGNPKISLVFMHLPDGNLEGQGFDATGDVSLQQLWDGTISGIQTVDGSTIYTKDTLLGTLTSLIAQFQPDRINTQDYTHTYGDGDHSDHYTVSYFVEAASQDYSINHLLTGYTGYPVTSSPANIFGPDLIAKQFAYYTYARNDPAVCYSLSNCNAGLEAAWLVRQYAVTQEPVANAGANQVVGLNAMVQLDGSDSSDPNNVPLIYQWTQIGGTSVMLSSAMTSQPVFTTSNSTEMLVFQLVVSNGQTSSTPATVSVTSALYFNDVALSATATASSESSGTGQTADKATDGIIDGYPRDSTKEWATGAGHAGSWLTLTWNSPQTVDTVILYDRPNVDDQITGAIIEFDDGDIIPVGALDNYGTATSFGFPAKSILSLTLNITSVSGSTQNVGLAEIQVLGTGR